MSVTVRDCMNPKLVYVREGDRADLALQPILDFGITVVPVLDEDHRPVGTVSLRDLVNPNEAAKAQLNDLHPLYFTHLDGFNR